MQLNLKVKKNSYLKKNEYYSPCLVLFQLN